MDKIEKVMILAEKMPAGLNDPKASEKLKRESLELLDALAEALLEAADCAYYAIKLHQHNHHALNEELDLIARASNQKLEVILECAVAKYTLRSRAGNPKDKPAELEAAKDILLARNLSLQALIV